MKVIDEVVVGKETPELKNLVPDQWKKRMQNSEVEGLSISLMSFLEDLSDFEGTRRVFRTVLPLVQSAQSNDSPCSETTPPD